MIQKSSRYVFCRVLCFCVCMLFCFLSCAWASAVDELRVKTIGGIEKNIHFPNTVLQRENNKSFTITAQKVLQKIDLFIVDVVKKPQGSSITTRTEKNSLTLHPQGAGAYELVVKAMKYVESG